MDRKPSHLQIMEDLASNDELMAAKIQVKVDDDDDGVLVVVVVVVFLI